MFSTRWKDSWWVTERSLSPLCWTQRSPHSLIPSDRDVISISSFSWLDLNKEALYSLENSKKHALYFLVLWFLTDFFFYVSLRFSRPNFKFNHEINHEILIKTSRIVALVHFKCSKNIEFEHHLNASPTSYCNLDIVPFRLIRRKMGFNF